MARTLPSQHSSVLTSTIVGTPLYMAPEAIGGTITKAADVYAFGVVRSSNAATVYFKPLSIQDP